jgi:hypothetical protein
MQSAEYSLFDMLIGWLSDLIESAQQTFATASTEQILMWIALLCIVIASILGGGWRSVFRGNGRGGGGDWGDGGSDGSGGGGDGGG